MRFLAGSMSPGDLWSGMDWWKNLAPSQHELAVLLAATGCVGLMAIIWAVFIRKRKNDGSSRYIYETIRRTGKDGSSNASGSDSPAKRRRRRRHRRRNPTLAEAGGLPPIRNETLQDDPP